MDLVTIILLSGFVICGIALYLSFTDKNRFKKVIKVGKHKIYSDHRHE